MKAISSVMFSVLTIRLSTISSFDTFKIASELHFTDYAKIVIFFDYIIYL